LDDNGREAAETLNAFSVIRKRYIFHKFPQIIFVNCNNI
jgi:hypothetical protein